MGMDQRLIQVQIYREQPSSSQSSTSSSSAHTVSRSLKQEQSVESQNVRSRPSEGSTLTAASLIDAIITHQINQSSEGQSSSLPSGAGGGQQTQHTRPGDRLFQSFHRECSESNGKVSPMKSNLSVENKSQHSSQQQVHGNEHMEVYGNQAQSLRSSMYQGYEPQTWKLRRALQSKDVEPPMHEKPEEHVNRGYYADPPVPLSPLDYVKNRIAEVMRTSEEDGAGGKGNDSPISPDINDDMESAPVVSSSPYISQNPHAYTYPYSALSLTTGSSAGVSMAPQTVNKPGNEPIPEPAPLLSAQYEPLSDED
uniref:Nuclear receptor corepressor 1 n=2 Tax=Lygus hesperus TaxID=30085 RepID=A0A0A9YWS2_LYGHE